MNMHDIIALVEAGLRPKQRTIAHKPFDDVGITDIVHAFFDIDDIRDIMHDGWWEEFPHPEDAAGDPIVPPMPKSSAELTPEQVEMLSAEMTRLFERSKNDIAAAAANAEVPLSRRLNRLSDLSQPLGVHWSYGNRTDLGTETYGEHQIFAVVANGDVDWITTIARGMFWWHEEGEITPVRGSSLKLVKLVFGPSGIGTA
jgi:hypothetical protein